MDTICLRLCIAGMTPTAERAINNLRALTSRLEEKGQPVEVEIIDILENPEVAEDEHILATPVVIRKQPMRRMVGDLSELEKVLTGLDLRGL